MEASQVNLGPGSTQEIAQLPKEAAGHDANGPAGGAVSFCCILHDHVVYVQVGCAVSAHAVGS